MPIRITLVRPPAGVAFSVQARQDQLLDRKESTGADLQFDVTVLAQRVGAKVRFFGDVTQGPPEARFIYVRSGTMAGQPESCWTRRAKVPLSGLTWAAVVSGARTRGRLEARIDGQAKDGGPACASVPLLGSGWRPIP